MGIAVLLMLLLSSAAVIAATPPTKNASDDNSSGYSTYIVAFKGEPGSMSAMDSQITSFVSSHNGQIVDRYSIINGMAISIPDDRVDELKAMDNVKYIEKDQKVHALLDKAVPQIGAPEVWNSEYTGKGVKVAVIDTGIDASHPDLNGGKVVGWVDYVQGKTSPYDDHGHGTHCASTVAGTGAGSDGKYKGVAPEASLIGVKVLGKDGSGSNTNIIKGIDWAVKNNADVISMSLGGSQHSQASDDAVNNAIKAGVTVVIAAGNSGPGAKTIACPGDNPNAITVGASDRNDQIASFSSRGPTYDGRIKPDVTNMGVGLVAARAKGTSGGKPLNDYYTAMSGTSMATPMTAGTVALLLQAKPDMTPQQVKDALTKTAKQLGGSVPNNNYGYGRVQANAALEYVLSGKIPAPTPTPTPDPSVSPSPTVTPGPNPSPEPGNYAVSLITMFARYDGKLGRMDQFRVTPATTLEQNMMIANVGESSDSYTVTVDGIPDSWYRIARYNGEYVEPSAAAFLTMYLTPEAGTATGTYKFTVTATSNSDRSVSNIKTYAMNVYSTASTPTPTITPTTTPTPTITPTVTPGPTVTPTVTPVPPAPGVSFSGTVTQAQDYYTYIVPSRSGQVSATVSWQNTGSDLDAYLYSPGGDLVAKSESRYTTKETVQYSGSPGYYLLKVRGTKSFGETAFTGTSSANVAQAYVKTGAVQPGQPVTYTVNADGYVNARVAWQWSFNTLVVSVEDANGNEVAQGKRITENFFSAYEQVNHGPVKGTYKLKLTPEKPSGTANYKLITPYQL